MVGRPTSGRRGIGALRLLAHGAIVADFGDFGSVTFELR
jgi:hypothetical protein